MRRNHIILVLVSKPYWGAWSRKEPEENGLSENRKDWSNELSTVQKFRNQKKVAPKSHLAGAEQQTN
jgi:hypothetical protein